MTTATEEGCILVGATDRGFVIRLQGRLTQESIWNMDQVIERYDAAGPPDVLVDVAHCTYMDSTMLGLLARCALVHHKAHAKWPFLVGLGEGDLARVFKRMSLDRLFENAAIDVMAHCPNVSAVCAQSKTDNNRTRADQVLLAHETLAELSPENAADFALLIEILNKEMEKDPSETPGSAAPNR